MVQPRKRAATGLQSNKQKQTKHQDNKVHVVEFLWPTRFEAPLLTLCLASGSHFYLFDLLNQEGATDDNVYSEKHDLFDDLDLEATGDVEKFEDQEQVSDNEDMIEEQLEMEEDEPKSLLEAPDVAKRFRDFYMAKLTQAFPNDLDQIRQKCPLQEENFDHNKLEILIDSLEAGVDIFSDMEKNFAIMSS
ncbi:hypothetical protein NQZ79_g5831 [Umbelopsis isabellina]|nr:hypothetical protein NQZ79_g5831 [Umbelopsis isabellina]